MSRFAKSKILSHRQELMWKNQEMSYASCFLFCTGVYWDQLEWGRVQITKLLAKPKHSKKTFLLNFFQNQINSPIVFGLVLSSPWLFFFSFSLQATMSLSLSLMIYVGGQICYHWTTQTWEPWQQQFLNSHMIIQFSKESCQYCRQEVFRLSLLLTLSSSRPHLVYHLLITSELKQLGQNNMSTV